jgi:hypothetical protein
VCVNGVIEDTYGVFEDYAANPTLIWISLTLIFTSFMINCTGVTITKLGSSAQRTTVGLAKNAMVWIVFLVIPISYYDKERQVWDSHRIEKFSWPQLIGFIVLMIGVLMFNEILVIPYWGLNRYTKKAMANNDQRSLSIKI